MAKPKKLSLKQAEKALALAIKEESAAADAVDMAIIDYEEAGGTRKTYHAAKGLPKKPRGYGRG